MKDMKPTKGRLDRLSDICARVAEISILSVVIPFLFDKFNLAMIVLGLVVAFVFWTLSWYFAK